LSNFYLTHYRCTQCGKEYKRDEVRYLCPVCSVDYKVGIPLKGALEAIFDYEAIAAGWKQSPDPELFSAVEPLYYPELPVGNTPLFRSNRLALEIGLADVLIKNDGLNPSGSLKDRASHLMVAEAIRLKEKKVVTASTGNAACALSALCASAGLEAVIFAPKSAPPAKLIQIKVHGAKLIPVDGTYDDAFAVSLDYTATEGGLNRNTGYHPLTIEGKKSVGMEIFVQNSFNVPDWIVVPVGDGVILTAVHKAFLDLQRAGLVSRLPHLLSVQAESSDAITRYFASGTYSDAERPVTIADSIKVRTPSLAHWAVQALIESNGACVLVTDDEIRQAQLLLAQTTGVFAEPAAASTLAGLIRAKEQHILCRMDQVVLLVSGHGLKDTGAVKI
jgi:threonine synthase